MIESTRTNGGVPLDQLYEHSIKPLPVGERLHLARRILNDIPPESVVDFQTHWSEEDLRDVTTYSLQRATASLEDEENA